MTVATSIALTLALVLPVLKVLRPDQFDLNGGMCRIADHRRRVKGHIRTLENFHEFFRAPTCRGRADILKLQSKLSNSAAEQTGLRDYMASKVDCKCVGNKVGVAA